MEPRFRFKDENGNSFPDWENLKLEDLFTKINQKNVNGVIDKIIANSAELGLVDQHVVFDRDIAQKGKTDNYTIIQKGDFVYNPRKSKEAPYGPFNCYGLNEKGVVSPLYICLRPKYPYMTHYLLWYFKSSSWYSYVADNGAQGGARHDRVGMSDSLMKGIPVKLPSVPEQQKIADFLSSYDEKISIQRERVEALERRKKGLLQKIFSQEIRFKADNGTEYPKWSNSTFSSVFTSVGNNTFSRSDLTSDNSSNIRNIHYGDVLIKYGEIINTEVDSIPYIKKNISLSNNNDKLLQNGDIVFADTAEDNTVGKACEIALSDFRDKIVSGLHTIAVRPTIQFASGYLGYFLNSSLFHDQLLPLIQGIKVSSISKKALFEETRVYYPSYQEQQKISDLFTIISEQIKVERERLSTMETIKNGLLQGLFC